MNRQPSALLLLNFVSMWENFSYYGMRVLLVLFMTEFLHMGDSSAFLLYALYTTLVELGGVVGGIVADRFLGLKRCILLGGWTIALGHLCLAIPDTKWGFFLGLGLIIVGTSLFRSNVAALLGEFYSESDPRRDAGFTLYYTGINIGGFLATLFCGIVGEMYGWHAGFSLAAFGMLSGNIALLLGWKILEGKGDSSSPAQIKSLKGILGLCFGAPLIAWVLFYPEIVTPWIPLVALAGIVYTFRQSRQWNAKERKGLWRLFAYLLFMMVFYACEEQLGSSLILFAERHVDRNTFLGSFPAASLIMFNPLTILLGGPLLSSWMQKFPLNGMNKIGASFFLLGVAFLLLYCGCLSAKENTVPLFYVVGSTVLIALGEIFIAPTVFSYASEIAPAKSHGLVMGMVTMGFSLANLFSGFLSQTLAIEEESASLTVYLEGFALIGSIILSISLCVIIINNRKKAFSW